MDNPVFEIINEKLLNYSVILVRNKLNDEYFSVIPEFGGRLKELYLSIGGSIIQILRKVNNLESKNRDDIYLNTKLSPFAGRIKKGEYIFENKRYKLPLNYPEENNACHGFIYNKKFYLHEKEVSNEYASVSLKYVYDKDNEGYPFSFTIIITYKLTLNNGLVCNQES